MLQTVVLPLLTWLMVAQGHQVCYEGYGCFSDNAPFNDNLVPLPQDPKILKTTFSLHTKQNVGAGESLKPLAPNGNANDTSFDGSKRTVVIVHGFMGHSKEQWVGPMTEALLIKDDFNVIVVDWKEGAKFLYHQAVANTRIIGAETSKLIGKLIDFAQFSPSAVHCIGFGLGAHICGYLGRNIRRNGTMGPIGRITGLQPAGPYFENKDVDRRLDPTDAGFVDVIHSYTPSGLLQLWVSTAQQMGHVDFYPNGGKIQPGCSNFRNGVFQFFACSHYRAVDYFIESLTNGHCSWYAYPCKDYKTFTQGLCAKCPASGCLKMGYEAVEQAGQATGKFFLRTLSEKPYCGYQYNITIRTGNGIFAGYEGVVSLQITGDQDVSRVIKLPYFDFKAGSTNRFVIQTRKNLGKLLKLKVTNDAIISMWYLNDVVVDPMWTNNKQYTACFKRTINNPRNEVKFHTKQPGYCV